MSAKTQQNLIDRTPFWGLKQTPELKYLQQVLNNKNPRISLNRSCFRELLKTLALIFDQTVNSIYLSEKINAIADQFKIPVYDLTLILASLLKLLKSAMRVSSIKQEIVKEDLLEFLRLPNEYVTDFTNILYSQKRESIENILVNAGPQNNTIVAMDWRVDVSISTSSLNRTLEPSIYLKLQLSNGQKISFEMTLQAFHLLRFSVTSVLKEMDDALNRQLFKLTD